MLLSGEATIGIINLEACNRLCGHCFMDANSALPQFGLSDLKLYASGLKFSPNVIITFGEPMFYRSVEDGTTHDLSDMVKCLLSRDEVQKIQIVTSGINPASKREQKVAEKLLEIRREDARRVSFVISFSDYPQFGGKNPIDVQMATLKFALANGFSAGIITFHSREKMRPALAMIRSHGLEPFEHSGCGAISMPQDGLHFLVRYREPCGNGRMGMAQGYLSEEDLFVNNDGSCSIGGGMSLSISPDGSLGPGCCKPYSPFIAIANAKLHAPEQINEFAKAFYRRRIMESARNGCVSCTNCITTAPALRETGRLFNVIGPNAMHTVLSRRANLAAR